MLRSTTLAVAILTASPSLADPGERLLEAAKAGDAESVEALLKNGADVNARTEYGATALSFAADKGHIEVVKTLLRYKADVNAKDTFYNATPMTWAVMRGHDEIVTLLTEAGAKPVPKITPKIGKKDDPEPDLPDVKPVPDDAGEVKVPLNWPQFRGPHATGVADGQHPPITWDVEKGVNVRWKTPIPGLGHSCPVVWGDRVFLTSAVSDEDKAGLKPGNYGDVDSVDDKSEHEWHVYAIDKKTGQIVWDRTACTGTPHVKRHLKGTHANPTPATDGKHLAVSFGSEGLYCYDLDGELLWKRDLGTLGSGWFYDDAYEWGFGSSPIIYRDMVIVQCDIGEGSFLAAFDVAGGKELWRTPREEIPSWGTPTVVEGPDRVELVTNATKFARGYDPFTGKELWRLGPFSEITVPTPFFANGLIFITSGYRPVQPIVAVKPGASGDISLKKDETANEFVAWSTTKGGPYLPTPIAYGEHLYACSNSGMVSCFNAETGEKVYDRERLGGRGAYTGSPVAADGRLYFTAESGDVRVVKAGPEFELLAANPLGEVCMTTPAISDGMMFFRTEHHLIAVGRDE